MSVHQHQRQPSSQVGHGRQSTQGSQPARISRGFRFRPALMGVCFSAGVVLGVLGTALHGNIHMIGPVQDGILIPWGAVLALLLCLLAQLWAGLRAGSLVEPTFMGVVTFTVATIAYMWPGPDQLMIPYSAPAMDLLPGPTIASLLWWLGSAAVTLLSMLLVRWILARDAAQTRGRRSGRIRDAQPAEHNMTPTTTAPTSFSSER